jgi:hypothetical protein
MLKRFLILAVIMITAIGCRDYREVHFWIINNTDQDVTVRYRVRTCLGMNSNCFPQNFSNTVEPNDSVMLQIQDQVTTDYDIEESFFDFGLYQNDNASEVNIWRNNLVEKDIFEERIEFFVRVEKDFFK